MTRTLALAALLAALAFPAPGADIGIADYEITGARDTALVLALDAAVERTTKAVGDCRETGATLGSCLCESRAEIAGVRAALEAAVAANPHWEGKTLFLRDTGDGQSLTIFLDTVARQAEAPECP